MHNFKLVCQIQIKNAILNIDENEPCFLYNFSQSGIGNKQLAKWLNNKLMDIYEFQGRYGKVTVCPWCKEKIGDDPDHISEHGKSIFEVESVKLSRNAYPLLLEYLRNGNYDALAFLIKRSCQYCINPTVKGREGKCAIPESSRNKMRSLKLMGFKCDWFKYKDYTKNSVAIIYKRRPSK